jgi:hypothetical protein
MEDGKKKSFKIILKYESENNLLELANELKRSSWREIYFAALVL